jgi:hypothetical protein
MSRTRHSLPRHCHKRMKHLNQRKMEISVIDSIKDENVKIRHLCRILSYKCRIPNPWDDYMVSAWGEFHNKHFYDNETEQSHYRKIKND